MQTFLKDNMNYTIDIILIYSNYIELEIFLMPSVTYNRIFSSLS